MLKINYYFCNTNNSFKNHLLKSHSENLYLNSFNEYINKSQKLEFFFFIYEYVMHNLRYTANVVLKDMLLLNVAWRHIRGYPSKGSTTHTNAKTSRKNKLLFNYRLNQFYTLFGKKKRNIYPTLIKAEYNNRLWYTMWKGEWLQASCFVEKMLKIANKQTNFNPILLANNQTNGYIRIGKASKIGKAKKLTKVFTIGVPVFFTRFIYYTNIPSGFSKRLTLKDDINKGLGKKIKKNINKC